jgi:hypothetical protein
MTSVKEQLQKALAKIKNEIQAMDETSIYSLTNILYNNDEIRHRIVKKHAEIEAELMYIEDDEKRNKYRSCRDRDPLKYGRKKTLA